MAGNKKEKREKLCTKMENAPLSFARTLQCTEADITLAILTVGDSNLKIQEFLKKKKVIDNGRELKVYTP